MARSLRTDDAAEAQKRALGVAAEMRAEIEALRRNADGTRKDTKGDPTEEQRVQETWWIDRRAPHPTLPGRFVIPSEHRQHWAETLDERAGEPLNRESDGGRRQYDPDSLAAAQRLAGIVLGTRTPIAHDLDRYLKQQVTTASYASRTRSAVSRLSEWRKTRPGGDCLTGVTGAEADAFADHVGSSGITTATLNSLLSALSCYWSWMEARHVLARGTNPWKGLARRVVDRRGNAEKRPFTDDEMVALLSGPATRTMHDLMRLAALSGLRFSEITSLTVQDVAAGSIRVRVSKTRAGVRDVPTHPNLARLIERRTAGKGPDDFLIEELTAPPSRPGRRGGKQGERFTAYRRDLGLDARKEGRRQSDADFHSFRRWFVTKAEQADQRIHVIAAVVGHEFGREGVTLGTYSAGPSVAQRRAVVSSVRLPEGAPIETPEGPMPPVKASNR